LTFLFIGRPIIEMARAALEGRIRSRTIALPAATTPNQREKLIATLEERAATPERFVTGLEFVYDATRDDGIAVYDAVSGQLRVNGLHPFVGAFFDEFTSKTNGLPLEIFGGWPGLARVSALEGAPSKLRLGGILKVWQAAEKLRSRQTLGRARLQSCR